MFFSMKGVKAMKAMKAMKVEKPMKVKQAKNLVSPADLKKAKKRGAKKNELYKYAEKRTGKQQVAQRLERKKKEGKTAKEGGGMLMARTSSSSDHRCMRRLLNASDPSL